MEATKASNRIHPLVATAAVSVTLASMVGIAAITGLLPNSHSSDSTATPAPAVAASAPVAATPAPVAAAAPATLAPVAEAAPSEAPAPAAAPAKKPVTQHKTAARPAPKRVTEPQPDYSVRPTAVAQAPSICESCGHIESVDAIQQPGKPSGLGVVAGAVLGGALGNQVGGGNGRKLATVAGVVGGGFAGNEIEKRTRTTTTYQVRVRMEDGTVRSFPYDTAPSWHAGDRVRVINGSLTSRG